MTTPNLSPADLRAIERQRRVGRLFAPLWVPACVAVMRWGFGWKVRNIQEIRRSYADVWKSGGPLMICANHLTMLDSCIIGWALGSPWWYVLHYGALPWNTPERENFASTWWKRTLIWLMKCVPIVRGGDRRDVGATLNRLTHLMQRGEAVLIFPEGGRSRTGRVDAEAVTYGVGRLVKASPGCRVLCIYLRGDRQGTWTQMPARGERFDLQLECFEPKTDQKGMRGTLDLNGQILGRLVAMEANHFRTHAGVEGPDGR